MTVFREYIFSRIRHRNAAKSPELSKNDRIFQNNIFRGYKFSRTVSKTAKSAKINTNNVRQLYLLWTTTIRSLKINHYTPTFYMVILVHIMLLLPESGVHTRKYLLWRHVVRTQRSEVRAAWRHSKYFPYGANSRLIGALLYTHTSKTTKRQCFPLLLWIEVQPVHTPVLTQAYGPALSQSNFSILSVFCLVYDKKE